MLQVAFNGLVSGIIVTLPALAITLLFGVLKFPNFSVGAIMTLAAYLVYALNVQLQLPLLLATGLAAVACGPFLILVDRMVFHRLRERGSITLMVASLGLGFILENVVRLLYGNASRAFNIELASPFRVLGIRMNFEQMVAIGVSIISMLAMYCSAHSLTYGRAMRAVADNPSLALVRGIDKERR